MMAVMAFIGTPLGKRLLEVMAAIALVAALVGYIYHAGSKAETAKYEKAQTIAAADVKTHEATAATVSTKIGGHLAAQHAANGATFAPLLKRVQTDVSDQDNADCRVPDGWRRLWLAGEAGADGGLSPSAGEPQGPAAEAAGAAR